jgi:hypothetical protein
VGAGVFRERIAESMGKVKGKSKKAQVQKSIRAQVRKTEGRWSRITAFRDLRSLRDKCATRIFELTDWKILGSVVVCILVTFYSRKWKI